MRKNRIINAKIGTKCAKNGLKCLKNAIKNANPVFKSFKKKKKEWEK